MPYEIAQAIGIVATVITILSFQQKNQKGIVFCQTTSAVLWSVHFFAIGAITGALLNIIASVRNAIMTKRNKWKWTGSPLVIVITIALSVLVYVLMFTVFGTKPTVRNLIVEFIPVVGMLTTTLAFRETEGKRVRLLSILNCPPWFTYDLLTGSIGGVITESFCFVSILIGYLRHDRNKK